MEIKQAKVEETYRHKKTGEVFKERKDWESKGYKNEDMAQDEVKQEIEAKSFFLE